MLIWHIGLESKFRELVSRGRLVRDLSDVPEDFASAYGWMRQQMIDRLGLRSDDSIGWPLWSWQQYHNDRRKMPDLRNAGNLPRGTKGVRLWIEKDESEILLSDFELWHYVLSNWYLPTSMRDMDRFELEVEKKNYSTYLQRPIPNTKYDYETKKSWGRIFDLDWQKVDIRSPRDEKAIQATFFELALEEVKRVDFFVAR
jgi:hypothetical protein